VRNLDLDGLQPRKLELDFSHIEVTSVAPTPNLFSEGK
jgi:hypothetical protein